MKTMKAQAEQMGKAAFAAGKPCVPALDQDFCATIPEASKTGPKAVLAILNAWHTGWAKANCAAPVI